MSRLSLASSAAPRPSTKVISSVEEALACLADASVALGGRPNAAQLTVVLRMTDPVLEYITTAKTVAQITAVQPVLDALVALGLQAHRSVRS